MGILKILAPSKPDRPRACKAFIVRRLRDIFRRLLARQINDHCVGNTVEKTEDDLSTTTSPQ